MDAELLPIPYLIYERVYSEDNASLGVFTPFGGPEAVV